MKTIYLTIAAASAMAVVAPVAAQPGNYARAAAQPGDYARPAAQDWYGDRSSTSQLQARFDEGVQSGAISRREAGPLRARLNQFASLERQYSRAGFNGWERNALRERSRTLSMDIMAAERTGNGRFNRGDRIGMDDRYDQRGQRFGNDERRDHRGDRYAGDLRVGQRYSDRLVVLPVQYRDRYRDSDSSFYRYDEDRIYQINRSSGLIMAMFDIQG